MFNSAFLLMYIVGLVGFLTPVLACAAGLITMLAAGWYIGFCDAKGDDRIRGMSSCRTYVLIATLLWIFAAAIPSTTSLYAGAGQYVVEVAEIDDTLIGLRDLIDAKITELTIESLEETADQLSD